MIRFQIKLLPQNVTCLRILQKQRKKNTKKLDDFECINEKRDGDTSVNIALQCLSKVRMKKVLSWKHQFGLSIWNYLIDCFRLKVIYVCLCSFLCCLTACEAHWWGRKLLLNSIEWNLWVCYWALYVFLQLFMFIYSVGKDHSWIETLCWKIEWKTSLDIVISLWIKETICKSGTA